MKIHFILMAVLCMVHTLGSGGREDDGIAEQNRNVLEPCQKLLKEVEEAKIKAKKNQTPEEVEAKEVHVEEANIKAKTAEETWEEIRQEVAKERKERMEKEEMLNKQQRGEQAKKKTHSKGQIPDQTTAKWEKLVDRRNARINKFFSGNTDLEANKLIKAHREKEIKRLKTKGQPSCFGRFANGVGSCVTYLPGKAATATANGISHVAQRVKGLFATNNDGSESDEEKPVQKKSVALQKRRRPNKRTFSEQMREQVRVKNSSSWLPANYVTDKNWNALESALASYHQDTSYIAGNVLLSEKRAPDNQQVEMNQKLKLTQEKMALLKMKRASDILKEYRDQHEIEPTLQSESPDQSGSKQVEKQETDTLPVQFLDSAGEVIHLDSQVDEKSFDNF